MKMGYYSADVEDPVTGEVSTLTAETTHDLDRAIENHFATNYGTGRPPQDDCGRTTDTGASCNLPEGHRSTGFPQDECTAEGLQ